MLGLKENKTNKTLPISVICDIILAHTVEEWLVLSSARRLQVWSLVSTNHFSTRSVHVFHMCTCVFSSFLLYSKNTQDKVNCLLSVDQWNECKCVSLNWSTVLPGPHPCLLTVEIDFGFSFYRWMNELFFLHNKIKSTHLLLADIKIQNNKIQKTNKQLDSLTQVSSFHLGKNQGV